jgi:hypothetical protein
MTARQILQDALRRRPKLATSRWSGLLAACAVMIADEKGDWEYLTSWTRGDALFRDPRQEVFCTIKGTRNIESTEH